MKNYLSSERQKSEWDLYLASNKRRANKILKVSSLDNPNIDKISKVFKILFNRHEALRTTFVEENSELRQVVRSKDSGSLTIEHYDFSNEVNSEAATNILIANEKQTPSDLENGPLSKAILIFCGGRRWILVYVIDHIISDATSLLILKSEFIYIYQCLLEDKAPNLEPLHYHMKDYAIWESSCFGGKLGERNLAYWRQDLSSNFSLFNLQDKWRPHNFNRKKEIMYKGGKYNVSFGERVLMKSEKLTKRLKVSLFVVVLSSIILWLYCLTGLRNIVVSIPFSTRDRKEFKNIIGYLTTGLYINMEIAETLSIEEFLCQVSDKYYSAIQHKNYSMRKIDVPIDKYCAGTLSNLTINRDEIESVEDFKADHFYVHEEPYYPFNCDFLEHKNGFSFSFFYNRRIFESEFIPTIFDKYTSLLFEMMEYPNAKINHIKS